MYGVLTNEPLRRREGVRSLRLTDAAKYEILYDQPSGEYRKAEAGATGTSTVIAGDSLEVECFPVIRVDDGARREKLRRKTGRYQEELNMRNTRKKIRRIAEANFTEEDVFWTGTYAYPRYDSGMANHLDMLRELEELGCPMEDGDVRRDFKAMLKKLKRRVKAKGADPREVKYLYVIESTKEAPEGDRSPLPPRYHIHALIHAPGLSREEIEECWSAGYSNTKKLDFSSNGISGLCAYLGKQRRCGHRWACSRNCSQPEIKKSYRKISRRRAAQIAADVQHRGREIFEKLYPGYRLEEVSVKYSDFVAGAYIYARMRRRKT